MSDLLLPPPSSTITKLEAGDNTSASTASTALIMDNSSNRTNGPGITRGFSQVPDQLFYNTPRKEDFLPRSSNWRDGLNNVLSSVESNQHTNNPIVLFKNEKYVCTYDMVSP